MDNVGGGGVAACNFFFSFFIDAVGCFTCDITINGGREPTRGHKYYVVRVQNCKIFGRRRDDGHCVLFQDNNNKNNNNSSSKKVKSGSRLYDDEDDLYGHQPYSIYFVRHIPTHTQTYTRASIQAFQTIYDKIYITHSCVRVLRRVQTLHNKMNVRRFGIRHCPAKRKTFESEVNECQMEYTYTRIWKS